MEERLWLLEGGGAFWCRLFGRAAGEIFWGILCLGRGNRERNGRSFSGERGEGVLRERGECWNQRVREKHSRRTEESACSFLFYGLEMEPKALLMKGLGLDGDGAQSSFNEWTWA